MTTTSLLGFFLAFTALVVVVMVAVVVVVLLGRRGTSATVPRDHGPQGPLPPV